MTEYGAKQQQHIPALRNEQKAIKKEFDLLAAQILTWCEQLPASDKDVVKIIKAHYLDFSRHPNKLHADLELNGNEMRSNNFRAKLIRTFLKHL